MAEGDVVIGLDAKTYYGTAGSTALNELTNIKDLTLNLEHGEADITTRGSGGWRVTALTLKEGSIEFEMLWKKADAGFAAIRAAYMSRDPVALAILDGDNGEGLDADFSVTRFTRNEPLEEGLSVSVTCKPTDVLRVPDWI